MWSPNNVKTFVINLDRRPDRWDNLMNQSESQRIPNLQRFSAIDGKTLDIDTDTRISTYAKYNIKNFTRRGHEMLDSIGGIGCALSHIGLWKKLVESDENVFLIMEDDIILPHGTWYRVVELFNETPEIKETKNWDIWSIGTIMCLPKIIHTEVVPTPQTDIKKWNTCGKLVGLNAYFITRDAAEKLLEKVFPLELHIDWFISYYAATNPFKILHNSYVNIQQIGVGSDIAMKSKCIICDLPPNVEDEYFLFPKSYFDLAAVTIVASVLGFVIFRRHFL